MNESAADVDNTSSDSETCSHSLKSNASHTASSPTQYSSLPPHPYNARPLSVKKIQPHDKGTIDR